MSGRGRGRGRGGRGGAATSHARMLLQKSAAEAGIDEKSAITMLRPPHFPEMLWHSSGRYMTPEEEAAFRTAELQKKKPNLQFIKRSAAMTFLVRKQRQLSEYFEGSAQHIQHIPPHLDIHRYKENGQSDRNPDRPDIVVREALGKLATTEHLPEELLGGAASIRRKNRKRRRNADGTFIDLDEFEKKERHGADGPTGANSEDESEEVDELELAPGVDDEEEEEDNQDYTTNYYESEDDSDGGGDGGEPTF